MKTILYIGNHLSHDGAYPSVAESLAPLLLPEVELHLVSRQRNRLLRLADMLLSILQFGRQEQPVTIDVYSTLNFWYALLSAALCRMLGLRYFCVLHGGNLPRRLQNNPFLCGVLFGAAEKLIAPSRYLQAAFREAGYEAVVISNGIPLGNYPFKLREKLRPKLLWVRAFDAIYNPQMAVKVLHQLAGKFPDAALCMVGPDKDGSMEACRKLARELGLEKRVQFTGRLPKEEWIALAADYDIFINTTNFDNTPVSVIEAMALGLPVVSTDVGGLPYLIEHEQDGLLVPVDLDEEMAKAVGKLLQDQQTATSLALRARKKVEGFDFEKVAQAWKRLLSDKSNV